MAQKQMTVIHTPYVNPDAYGSLVVPIYNNVSFEFADAQQMAYAFCNRITQRNNAKSYWECLTNCKVLVSFWNKKKEKAKWNH